MAKPMEKAGFYPGISVELVENVTPADAMDIIKNPLADDNISINVLFLFDRSGTVSLTLQRRTSIKAALAAIGKNVPDNIVISYRGV